MRLANLATSERTNKLLMRPRRTPGEPTPRELLAAKRCFPPNFLHESWADFLYWDVELES